MRKYTENKNYKLVNLIKIVIVLFLIEVLPQIIIYSYAEKENINNNIIYFFVLNIFLIFVVIYLDNIILKILNRITIRTPESEEIIILTEEIASSAEIRSPKVIAINYRNPIALSICLNYENSIFIISENLIEELNPPQKKFIIAHNINSIKHLDTSLQTILMVSLGFPIIMIDIACVILTKYKYNLISDFIEKTILLAYGILFGVFSYFLLSKSRIQASDMGASKLLETTNEFESTLQVINSAHTKGYVPLCIAQFLFTKNNIKTLLHRFLSIHPSISDRIMLIKGIIG
jgi:Zn-dependent protease with chaperone function